MKFVPIVAPEVARSSELADFNFFTALKFAAKTKSKSRGSHAQWTDQANSFEVSIEISTKFRRNFREIFEKSLKGGITFPQRFDWLCVGL